MNTDPFEMPDEENCRHDDEDEVWTFYLEEDDEPWTGSEDPVVPAVKISDGGGYRKARRRLGYRARPSRSPDGRSLAMKNSNARMPLRPSLIDHGVVSVGGYLYILHGVDESPF